MVGDVKQSIYKFRQVDPTLFMDKYHRFTKDGDQSGLRIDLSKNFRSRKEVLATTNYLFDHMMDEEVGEIEYDLMRDFILVLLNILINLCLLNYMH